LQLGCTLIEQVDPFRSHRRPQGIERRVTIFVRADLGGTAAPRLEEQ
jgi:hypothetical protein